MLKILYGASAPGVPRNDVGVAVLRVLDAGCGRNIHLAYPGLDLRNAYVVGIDVSQHSLDQNERLDEKILGDLQDSALLLGYKIRPESFDAAICQDVLEHLTDPDRALYTIVRALKPGGELILACSNPASPKGIVSKLTPHWFHRFVYKRGWFGYTFVDDPAYPPFKTYMRWSIQPSALRRTLSELGFTDIDLQLHDFRRFRWLGRKSEIRVRARKA